MNAKTQLDFHPDAETLNAFAERALAVEEHGQVTAHLAICGRCREVVFLAQAAATEEEALTVTTRRNEKWRGNWLRNWWVVWAPVATLATVVALAFYVHVRRTAVNEEMAKATQEASPVGGAQNDAVTPRPMDQPKIAASASVTAGSAAARAAAGKPEMNTSSQPAAPPPAPAEPQSDAPSSAQELDVQRTVTVQSGTVQSSDAMRAMQAEERASAGAEKKDERKQGEMHGAMQTAVAQAPAPAPAPTPAFSSSAAPMAGLAMGATKTARAFSMNGALLPSGLQASSTAAGSKATLAVDKAGAVFVSTDGGGHWESVARQWSGRAVTVRMRTNEPAVFELVNDQAQIWVSTDGRVWTAK